MHSRGDAVALAAVGFAFLAATVAAIAAGIAFGYDESVYAVLARHWLTGAPASGWDIHRPPGLSVLALVPQAFGLDAEWAHRLIGAAAGLGVVVAGWWAARTAGGPLAGLTAAVALAAAAPLQVESASFLTDVPSSFVLLLVAVLAWRHVCGAARIGRSFVWLGLVAAVAFYLRYGAIVELAGIAAACAVVAPRRLLDAWRTVAAATLVFAMALVPHIVFAVSETGTPWGILSRASRVARGGESLPLLDYAAWFPWALIGPLGAALALVGIVGAIRHWRTSPFARFLGVAALVPIAVLATLVHAEPRYVLFPMTLLVVLGSVEVAPLIDRRSPAVRAAVAALAIGFIVLGSVTTATETSARAESYDWKREVGLDIAPVAGPPHAPDCSVLVADVPITSWYSGCPADDEAGSGELVGSHRFVVVEAADEPPDAVVELTQEAEVWGTYVDGQGRPMAVVYLVTD